MVALQDVLHQPFAQVLGEIVSPPPPALAEICIEAPDLTVGQVLARLGLELGRVTELPSRAAADYGKYERARALYDLGNGDENPFRVLFG